MNKYKLNITFDFEETDNTEAINHAKYLLSFLETINRKPEVALNYNGDRSAKNLLAPVEGSPGHFKNHKINITEIK